MIIKKSRLKTFITLYGEKIGTEFEYENWDDKHFHVYAFDLTTVEEGELFNALYERFNEPNE